MASCRGRLAARCMPINTGRLTQNAARFGNSSLPQSTFGGALDVGEARCRALIRKG
jgi:hypothetical protein